MRARIILILAVLTGLMATSPASANTNAAVYLSCNGETPIAAMNYLETGDYVSWDETKPTNRAADGDFCSQPDTPLSTNGSGHYAEIDLAIVGEFDGPIENMTLRLWAIDVSGSRVFNTWDMDLWVQVDGTDVLKYGTVADRDIPSGSSMRARLFEVTITNVAVTADEPHTIAISMLSKYLDGSGYLVWVFDAAEWDSGLIFNDSTPASKLIPRNA